MRFIKFFYSLLFIISFPALAEPIFTPLNGEPIAFSQCRGKWVLINYWASWCPSCVNEIAAFNQLYATSKDKMYLFAVNYDHIPNYRLKKLVQSYHMTYPVLTEDPKDELHLGQIIGIPATFIFNPQGKLVETVYGQRSYHDLQSILARLDT